MNSSKIPYVIAGSTIGGAVAFLLLSDSGRRVRSSVRTMDAEAIPHKIEQVRSVLDRRAQDVTRKVDDLRHRVTESIDAGRRAYEESGQQLRTTMSRIETQNSRMTEGIHKSVDELNRTLYSLEKSIIEPLYQAMALMQGVRRGLRNLRAGSEGDSGEEGRNVRPMFDPERAKAL